MITNPRYPDTKHALKILIVVVTLNFLTALERQCNLFLTPWMLEFGTTQTKIALVPAFLCLAMSFGALTWTPLVEPFLGTTWGLRLAICFYTGSLLIASCISSLLPFLFLVLITGLGMSWMMPASGVSLNRWFYKYKMITNQTMEMGRALHVCTLPYLIQFVMSTAGWRWALRILAVLPLFVIYVIHYMSQRPDMPPPPNQTSDETEKMMPAESEKLPESGVSSRSNSSLKKDVEEKPLPMSYKPRENEQFLLRVTSIGVFCSFLAMATGRTLFVAYADGKSAALGFVMTNFQRATLVTIFNWGSVGIRLVIIAFRENIIGAGIKAGDMWFWGALFCIPTFGMTPLLCNKFGVWGLITASLIQGIALGIYQGQPITVLANIVGPDRMGKWMGIYILLTGMGNFIGPVGFSKLSQAIGNADWIYYVTTPLYSVALIAAIVLCRNNL